MNKDLQLRGAWLLLMEARAHVLHNKDFAADAVLAECVRQLHEEFKPEKRLRIIEARFWVNPKGKSSVGVDKVKIFNGRVSMETVNKY